jgi:hypothetical protein
LHHNFYVHIPGLTTMHFSSAHSTSDKYLIPTTPNIPITLLQYQ